MSDYPPVLIEEGALDIVQGPDGTLFTAAHSQNAIKFYAPDEEGARSEILKIKSVFPRRGPEQGSSTLTIYGDNLYLGGFPSVTVGGKSCAVQNPSDDSKITCTLPQGNPRLCGYSSNDWTQVQCLSKRLSVCPRTSGIKDGFSYK